MAAPALLSHSGRLVVAALGCAAAAVVGWQCVAVNLQRACTVGDTPYLGLCSGAPVPPDALRARISANPGDSGAYVQLALSEPSAEARPRLVIAAAKLAPADPTVLLMQAASALRIQDWPNAVPPLVGLAEYRGSPQAAHMLARLVAAGQVPLLATQLTAHSHWLELVLAQLPNAGVPVAAALPLVLKALQTGAMEPAAVSAYIAQLKTAGSWADAYSLWLLLHERALPVLYNGSFDVPFRPDGFDWEIAPAVRQSRAGAVVERVTAERRGAVLEVRLTGRAIPVPLVRQYLFMGPGRYRLSGDYRASQLRLDNGGMAWTVRCTGAAVIAGRTGALGDTGGTWQPFRLDISVPRDCGLVASLQLETHEPVDAAVGGRGRIAFDGFVLEKLGN